MKITGLQSPATLEVTPEEHGLEVIDLSSDIFFAPADSQSCDIGVQMGGLQRHHALFKRLNLIVPAHEMKIEMLQAHNVQLPLNSS